VVAALPRCDLLFKICLLHPPVLTLKRSDRDKTLGFGPDECIPQRFSKRLTLDLNDVTGFRPKAFLATQYAGTEEMDVNIAGPAKHGILEMVVFQVCDRMAHMVFASEHRTAPNFFLVSPDTHCPGQARGQFTQVQLGTVGAAAQL
jgi:hypothetical protein